MYQEVTKLKGNFKGVEPTTNSVRIEIEPLTNYVLEQIKTKDCTCIFTATDEQVKLNEEYMERIESIGEDLFEYVDAQYQVFREEWLIPRLEHLLQVFKETFGYHTETLSYLNTTNDIDIDLDDTKEYTATFEFMIKELRKDAIGYIANITDSSEKYKEFVEVAEEYAKVCNPRFGVNESFRRKINKKVYKDIKRLCKVYRLKLRTHVIEFK